jgi:hypothetical protein
MEYIPSDPILHREEVFEVRRNTRDGYFYRVDSQVKFHWRDVQGSIMPVRHAKKMTLLTPEMGYSLSKNNPNSRFYSLNEKSPEMGFALHSFDTAPFSVGPFLMEYLLFRRALFMGNTPYFIVSARYIEDEKEGQMVEFVSHIDRLDFPSRPSTWTIRLFQNSWVIRDIFEQGWTGAGKKYWKRYRCEYDGEFEGIPLLSKHHEETGIYDTDDAQTERLIQQVQWEVTKLVPGPVDLSEFDVTQFLQPAWLFATKIAAVVIAIALVFLGIYMRIRRS